VSINSLFKTNSNTKYFPLRNKPSTVDWKPSSSHFPTRRYVIRFLNNPVFSPKSQYFYTFHFLQACSWAHNHLSFATDAIQSVSVETESQNMYETCWFCLSLFTANTGNLFSSSLPHILMLNITQINVPIYWSAFCNVPINQTHFSQSIKPGHIHK